MVPLNDFFKAYANFKVEQGNLGLYTEFAAKKGNFKGYVKPIIKDIKIKREGDFLDIVWENIVAGAATILENRKKEQLATKVPIEGKFENAETDLWTAVTYVLRNAFVYALKPTIDNEINIWKVEQEDKDKTLLQKIFGKKNKDEGKKTSETDGNKDEGSKDW